MKTKYILKLIGHNIGPVTILNVKTKFKKNINWEITL